MFNFEETERQDRPKLKLSDLFKRSQSGMTGISSTKIIPTQPLVSKAVEMKIPPFEVDESTPNADSLRAARARLLAEYGPCAACHPELLIATARRIENERSQA